MFCKKCGTQLKDGTLFCTYCGTAVDVTPGAERIAKSAETAQQAAASDAPEQDAVLTEQPAVPTKPEEAPAAEAPAAQEAPMKEEPALQEAAPEKEKVKKKHSAKKEQHASSDKQEKKAHARSKKQQARETDRAAKKTLAQSGKRVSMGARCLAVFLSVLLVICALGASAVGTARYALDHDRLARALNQIDWSEAQLPLGEGGAGMTLPEYVVSLCADDMDASYTITEKSIGKVLRDSKIGEDLAEYAKGYTDYFLYGEKMRPLETDDVIDWIEDNEEIIFEHTGYLLTEEDRELLENLDFSALEKSGLEGMLGFDLHLIQMLIGVPAFVLLLSAVILLAILILLLYRRQPGSFFQTAFTVAIIWGALCLCAGAALALTEAFFADSLLAELMSGIPVALLLRGAIGLLVGIPGAALCHIICRKYRAAKAEKIRNEQVAGAVQ